MLPGNWDELTIASSPEFVPSLLEIKAKEIWRTTRSSVHVQGSPYIRAPPSFHLALSLYHMPSKFRSESGSPLEGLIQLRKGDLPRLGQASQSSAPSPLEGRHLLRACHQTSPEEYGLGLSWWV